MRAFSAVLVSLLCVGTLVAQPQSTPTKPRPMIIVEASYPGANASVVAETVDAPIENQLKGIAKVAYLLSRCGNDGSYKLKIVLEHGVDLDAVQRQVQERLAKVDLPGDVRGIKTWKWSGETPVFVKVHSPSDEFDAVYLSNYARVHLEDELKRVPGVGTVAILGGADLSVRIYVNPDKLAASGLSLADVIKAIRDKGKVSVGMIGQPPVPLGKQFQFTVTVGSFASVKEVEDLVVTTTDKGKVVRLKDVAKVGEEKQSTSGTVQHQGKPAVLVSIEPVFQGKPADLSAAVQNKLKQQKSKLPKGLVLDVVFDPLAGADHLLIDVTLPEAASAQRTLDACAQCAALLTKIKGIQDVLAFADFHLSNQGCLLVRLGPAALKAAEREQLKKAIRADLTAKVQDAVIQLRDFMPTSDFPWPDEYPIALGVQGPDHKSSFAMANNIAEKLVKSGKVTDVGVNAGAALVPNFSATINRKELAKQGVSVMDVFDLVQLQLGGFYVDDFNRFGKVWSVQLHLDGPFDREKFGQLKIRNDKGQMVSLKGLVTFMESQAPAAIVRWNGEAVVEISANLAPGASKTEIRKLCEALDKNESAKGFRLIWLAQ